MTTIMTTRFGQITVEEKRVIHFPDGLLGFAEQKHYTLLDHKPGSPFCWLQSMERPELAFVVTNPFLIQADYLSRLSPEERTMVYGKEESRKVVFVLVTVPAGRAADMTVNLQGPLVIDPDHGTGKQVVLANSGYHHRHPFFKQP